MITLAHGGQTGVDRGVHEAAIDNGWRITGYMPRDKRDELGPIPQDVARFLLTHDKARYAARTAANVRSVNAVLIIVENAACPRTTPGTAMTIDLALDRCLPCRIVDPTIDALRMVQWLWDLVAPRTLTLPGFGLALTPLRLLVAGPRESKWCGAQAQTAALLRRIALAMPRSAPPG